MCIVSNSYHSSKGKWSRVDQCVGADEDVPPGAESEDGGQCNKRGPQWAQYGGLGEQRREGNQNTNSSEGIDLVLRG